MSGWPGAGTDRVLRAVVTVVFVSLPPAHENTRIIWALLAQPERSYAANYGLHPLTTALLSPGVVHAEEPKNIKTSGGRPALRWLRRSQT